MKWRARGLSVMVKRERLLAMAVVAGFVVGVGLVAGHRSPPARAENAGHLMGSVVDLINDPLAGVLVEAWEVSFEVDQFSGEGCVGGQLPLGFDVEDLGLPWGAFVTDSSGEFDENVWGAGSWVVRATGAGLASSYFPSLVTGIPIGCFNFDEGPSVDVGKLVLEPEGSITGVVADSLGAGVAGLEVVAVPLDEEGKAADVGWTLSRRTITGQLGEFVIGGLESGMYLVDWLGDGVYLPGNVSGGSVVVDLGVGQDEQLSSNLIAVHGGSVSGAVQRESGGGVEGGAGRLEWWDGSEWLSTDSFETDAMGHWAVSGLLPGTYRAFVNGFEELLGEWSRDSMGGVAEVVLSEGGTGQFPPVVLPQGASVIGTVLASPGAAVGVSPEGSLVLVFCLVPGTGGVVDPVWRSCGSAEVDGNGAFEVVGLPQGPALVFAEGTEGLVGRYHDGEAFEEDSAPLTLAPPAATVVGNLVLPPAASIVGIVEDEYSNPVPDAPVFLYAQDSEGTMIPVGGGQADGSGQYSIGGLDTDSYALVAMDPAAPVDEPAVSQDVSVVIDTVPSQVVADPLVTTPTTTTSSPRGMTAAATDSAQCAAYHGFWLVTYNVGDAAYKGYTGAPKSGTVSDYWNGRLPSLKSKIASWAIDVLAVQEADPSRPSGTEKDQLTTLVKGMGKNFVTAVPKAKLDGLAVPKRPKNSKQEVGLSRKTNLIVDGDDVIIRSQKALRGMDILKDGTETDGYLNAVTPDKVFVWAAVELKGGTRARCKMAIVGSFHGHVAGHFGNSVFYQHYYNSLLATRFAEKLDGLSGNEVSGFAKLPVVMAGDFNSHVGTVTSGSSATKTPVKALLDGGWKDTRKETPTSSGNGGGYQWMSSSCDATCRKYATDTALSGVFDYVFVKNPYAIKYDWFNKIGDSKALSDHYMVQTYVMFK